MSTGSWLFGSSASSSAEAVDGSAASNSGDASSSASGEQPTSTSSEQWASYAASWTDAKKWETFAVKTQQDAQKLADRAQVEAIKLEEDAKKFAVVAREETARLSVVAAKVAHEKAAELSKHAAQTRNNYNPNDISSSILYGLGLPGAADGSAGPSRRRDNVTVDELDFVYITENIVAMPFPMDCSKRKCPQGMNDIMDVSSYLEAHHRGHYMVLNISEEQYDYSLFADQVLEYNFPGHPAPPLGVLFKICVAIESWLDADERNIVVIHCLTGKGRTAALTSCVLAWMGEFTSPMEALHYICTRKGLSVEVLTIPSQRRYIQYFGNMLDGIRPRSEPILLRRVIMNSIPKFEKKVTRVVHQEKEVFMDLQGTSNRTEEVVDVGCAPYVQLFKCGNLIATATPQTANDDNTNSLNLSWIDSAEGTASFTVNAPIRGDILLRCRHASSGGSGGAGQRVSMFRAAFHTGYVPSGVLRLTREQLDGAGNDTRFDDDFFIDLIFAPVVKATSAGDRDADTDAEVKATVTAKGAGDAPEDADIMENSEKYEQGLHKDARFWEGISNRKLKAKRRKQRQFTSDKLDPFVIDFNASGDDGDQDAAASGDDEEEGVAEVGGGSSADDDLISQLAYAEQLLGMEEDSASGDGRASPTLIMGGGEDADMGMAAAAVDDTRSDHSHHSLQSNTSSTVKVDLPVTAGASASSTGANKELRALEELERELGLEDLNMVGGMSMSDPSGGPSNPDPDSGGGGGGDDVSLDELEEYLQSINSSK